MTGGPRRKRNKIFHWFQEWVRPSCSSVLIIVSVTSLIAVMTFLDLKNQRLNYKMRPLPCHEDCIYKIVESIPENLTYPHGSPQFDSTYSSWIDLIQNAEKSIDIAAFYWTLRSSDLRNTTIPSAQEGEIIFQKLAKAGETVDIRIAQNAPSPNSTNSDSEVLAEAGLAKVHNLDFVRLIGAGVLHTKLWIVDGKHFYLGSANMDFRSLTQVKELGIVIQNCPCLAHDLQKIFEAYWQLGLNDSKIPTPWPRLFDTMFNSDNPMGVSFENSENGLVYFSSSPPSFCPSGRTTDSDAIVDVINKAEKFIYIAVMDYFPLMLYTPEHQYWPKIDNALRAASLEKQVTVCLLASYWNHTRQDMKHWLKSLAVISGTKPKIDIQVKLFEVPTFSEEQREIPFSRVNHNKYMVTDKTAYIGTSNWSGDYFTNTAGVALVVHEDSVEPESNQTLRQKLQSLFERDWNSSYAKDIDYYL